MKLIRVTINNFLSWAELEVPLDNQGLVLIFGKNGAGKSAIFDSIEWCFYKQISKKVPIDEVVRRGSKSCSVSVDFEDQRGTSYKVTRYRKDQVFGDQVRIVKEDSDITPVTIPEAERLLRRIVVWDRGAFNNSVLFSQDSEFYFSMVTDAQQKEVLRQLLGLTILSKCKRLVNEKLGKICEVEDRVEAKIETLDSEVSYLKKRISDSRKSGRIAVGKLVSEMGVLKKSQDSLIKEEIKKRKELSNLQKEIRKWEEALDEFAISVVHCPACGHSFGHSCSKCLGHKDGGVAGEDQSRIVEAIEERRRAKTRHTRDLESAKSSIQEYKIKIGSIEKLIETTKEAHSTSKDEKRLNQVSEMVSRLSSKLERLGKKRVGYEFWKRGFSSQGAELFAINMALPILNNHVRTYLSKLLSHVCVDFKIVNNKISCDLVSDRGAYRLGGLSTGQKRRVDISVGLGLRDLMSVFTGRSSNVLFLDEVFEGLDNSGISKVTWLLKQLSKGTSSVFIISHRSQLKKYFNQHKQVVLESGSSKIL